MSTPAHTHTFTVTVTCATADRATQVLAERLDHEEDYGFPYTLTWAAHEGEAVYRALRK